MSRFQIIPAIDLIDGEIVRLHRGRYDQKTSYENSPIKQAKIFEELGLEHLHIIDLDGAKAGNTTNIITIAEILKRTSLRCQVGGGVRTPKQISEYLDMGVSQVIVSSVLFDKDFNWEKVDTSRVTASLDFEHGKVCTRGWLKKEEVPLETLNTLLKKIGIRRVIVTDITKDGTLSGPNIDLTKKLKDKLNCEVIVAGGVTKLDDVRKAKKAGLDGVVIGKALYETNVLEECSDMIVNDSEFLI